MQNDLLDIYNLISTSSENTLSQKHLISARIKLLSSYSPLNKVAFDTRRMNQETEYNPRRGLQNYQRSEAFISEGMSQRIKNFTKLQVVLQNLEKQYGKEHEWQDSNARVLLSNLNNGLRTIIKDGDYSENQPALGSFDYLEELMFVRYRLNFDNLVSMSELQLRDRILEKDEELTKKDISKTAIITKSDISEKSYDSLMEKLFGGVKATADNKSVERTITITIKDTVLDEK